MWEIISQNEIGASCFLILNVILYLLFSMQTFKTKWYCLIKNERNKNLNINGTCCAFVLVQTYPSIKWNRPKWKKIQISSSMSLVPITSLNAIQFNFSWIWIFISIIKYIGSCIVTHILLAYKLTNTISQRLIKYIRTTTNKIGYALIT